ncbi:hypothetical protein [Methylocapsa acidiphila]|uniref:hypothetical protein n=1 Tax=Methylocapsa acidiphila TaxID=133552 RepID=UPI0004293A41|nr:hypothetical protein [Methylocapsa acidiphila]
MGNSFKVMVLAGMTSVFIVGAAWSESADRDATVQACWAVAHKEYPTDSGSDVNTSALAKGAYFLYAECMEKHGLKP